MLCNEHKICNLFVFCRYFYVTVIREPVARYLSEWRHVSEGATWKKAYLKCNGQKYEYTPCFTGKLV